MTFDDDFDEISSDLGFFGSKYVKRFQNELDELFESIKSGKMKGKWKARQINEPNVKGYIIQGYFGQDESLEPLEPLKPSKRRPLPERPFEIPVTELEETREPLTDMFEDENTIRIYAELPGEEKEDINLKVREGKVEIKARNFAKEITLPRRQVDAETMTSRYKNGVLEIVMQKKKEPCGKTPSKGKMV